jgi:hypothetical protein
MVAIPLMSQIWGKGNKKLLKNCISLVFCLNLAFNGISITQGLILAQGLSPNVEETLHVIKIWG